MGKSRSIEELQAGEDKYRAYLTKLQGQLKQSAKEDIEGLETHVQAFYNKNDWDNILWISGTNYDFMQQSDWSMVNVKKIIDAISAAVFGDSNAKLPGGTTIQKTNQTSEALAGTRHGNVYFASKAFEVLSGIVMSFGSSSSVQFGHATADRYLGNGFHVFALVACDAYKSQDFFNNKEIIGYLYAYQVRYSKNEADEQSTVTLSGLYEDQISSYAAMVEELLTKLRRQEITPQQYQSQSSIYTSMISSAVERLHGLSGKEKALRVGA